MRRPRLTAPIGALVLAAVLVSPVVPHTGHAAQPQNRPVPASALELMLQLNWMIGKWEGTGWIESARFGKLEFPYSLNARSDFEGLLLIVDGVGYEKTKGNQLPYAEHVVIFPPSPSALPDPPGTYIWSESFSSTIVRLNEAQGTARSLQVGYPFSREECDHIVADAGRRVRCRSGELKWSRVSISLNNDGEWVQTREWQETPGDDSSWHTYFKVVLRRAEKR